jgi:hypothetical protein
VGALGAGALYDVGWVREDGDGAREGVGRGEVLEVRDGFGEEKRDEWGGQWSRVMTRASLMNK